MRTVGKSGNRNAQYGIEHPERGAGQKSQLGIADLQVALDRFGKDVDDLPVEEIQRISQRQHCKNSRFVRAGTALTAAATFV
ncbi:hypothetical protein GCM10011494_20210 [Novosphingobium endophyticum]|uniref:Uncharacterized protein n=1 Tax=Novosphingobium endophyticum TaxID=1955250 RepID=A0A916X5L0_9SPHN|nr:hypothetical protein [Novosphingobium endophyticum]GGC01638.1 hypothetical protein GCM10011494_20210 [Novosphingobium endophyticum]